MISKFTRVIKIDLILILLPMDCKYSARVACNMDMIFYNASILSMYLIGYKLLISLITNRKFIRIESHLRGLINIR